MRMHTRICFALAVRLCWRRPLMWWRKVSVIALDWVWSGYIGSLLNKGSHFRYWLAPSHRKTSLVTITWVNRLSVALQHSEQLHEGVPKEPLSHHSRKEHIQDCINPPLAGVCNHLCIWIAWYEWCIALYIFSLPPAPAQALTKFYLFFLLPILLFFSAQIFCFLLYPFCFLSHPFCF